MATVIAIVKIWIALNLAISGFILHQRSPNIRHRVFRLTAGGLSPPGDRWQAHLLVEAAHRAHPH
jgi:hypothetical protein